MVLGKIRGLAVYFDTPNEHNLPAYSGGDLVSGRVVVEVTGDVRVKSLDITARGMAKVRWTESRNAGANTAYTQNYTEEVEYLHHYDTLIGEDRGKQLGTVCTKFTEPAANQQAAKQPAAQECWWRGEFKFYILLSILHIWQENKPHKLEI